MNKLLLAMLLSLPFSAFAQVDECKVPDNYDFNSSLKDYQNGRAPDYRSGALGKWEVVGMTAAPGYTDRYPTKYDCGGAIDEQGYLFGISLLKMNNTIRLRFIYKKPVADSKKFASVAELDFTGNMTLEVDKFSFLGGDYRDISGGFFTECRQHPSKEGYLSCLTSLEVFAPDQSSKYVPAWTWEFRRETQ